jgi:hypothetical protein
VFCLAMPFRLTLAFSLIALSLIAPGMSEAKPAIGLADNTIGALNDARFQQSGIKRVRILVPYDVVARGGNKLAELDTYMNVAQSQGLEVMVSWYRTYSCAEKCAKKRLPSVATYRKSVTQFMQRYPQVRRYSTWNEINFPAAQPTGNNPKRAAQFYLAHKKLCRAGRCSVLTGDFRANGSKFSAKWLKTFKKGIGRGRHTWGIVPHPEINAFHTRYTRRFLKDVKGDIWAVEAGAVNFFVTQLRPSLSRQTRAMRFMMSNYVTVSPRLKRMYVYHWQASSRDFYTWDSALLDSEGSPRPAYYEFFRGLGRSAPTLVP